nr:maestro heat-like repeat-containing protein family member 1 [Taeniopygia guttata]
MVESRVRRLALALLEAGADPSLCPSEAAALRLQLRSALAALGDAEPEELLGSVAQFLQQRQELPWPWREQVLAAVAAVIRSRLPELGAGAASAAVALAAQEMGRSKDPERQEAAGAVLVELGRRFLAPVLEQLLRKFPPGILPPPGPIRTLADLAAANVFGMVPFLSSILATLVPLLGTACTDSMKCTLCYALQRFGESIQEYLAGRAEAPDPTVRSDAFGLELGAAFDILSHGWMQARDGKVRLAALEALGPLSSLIPGEQLEEQLPKLLPTVLGLYRKHPEPFPISKSLCQLLEASVALGSRSLEAQLEPLLAALLAQLVAPADPNVPTSSKNQAELLRCFSVLAAPFPARLLAWLLPRLESGSERHRHGALRLLRHLLNSAPSQMEMQKVSILSALKVPLQDPSNKVKCALVQLISALAHHGFLEQPGAEALLEFLVEQCALPAEPPSEIPEENPEDPTSADVRSVSVSTLLLLSSTVPRLGHVLWPFLLPLLLRPRLRPALVPLCRSLAGLAQRHRPEECENLPSPQALTVRLLAVSSQPWSCGGRGAPALRLLRELRILPELEKSWNAEIPKLLRLLEENTEDSLDQQEWEEKLLQFLRESLSSIPDKSWICPLVSETFRQLRDADGFPAEKNFLYRSMGTALGLCPGKEQVRKQLQELLENARYQEETEREGLASCFGICARNHLEETLEKLEEFEKSDVCRKSQGLFSIFKDRSDSEPEQPRAALVLCLGRVAAAAPPELLRSRLEPRILGCLLQLGRSKVLGIKVETKDPALKLSLARSISMVGRALAQGGSGNFPGNFGNYPGNYPGNGPGASGSVAHKAELVALMVEFLRAEPPEAPRTRLRQHALSACAHLVALEPALSDSERSELLDTALGSVLPLPPPESGKNREQPGAQELFQEALAALTELLQGILRSRLSPSGLQEIFAHLGPWIRSPREPERERGLGIGKSLLEFFLENLDVRAVTPFPALPALLALLAPRCSDAIPEIRSRSLDCVRALLRIQLCFQGFSRDHRDELLEELQELKAGLENSRFPDFSVLFQTCSRLGAVLGRRIPPEQLPGLLLALLEAWTDPERNCGRAAAAIGNALIRERGEILHEQVPELLQALHARVALQAEPQLQRAAQRAVQLLALRLPRRTVGCLLARGLPLDSPGCCLWRALGSEPALTPLVLEQLLERLSREIPFQESPAGRVATALPLAATRALAELAAAPEAAAALQERFPELFQVLLLRLGGSVGIRLPKSLRGRDRNQPQPGSCAVQTMKAVLARAGNDDVVRDVGSAGGWELMEIPERHHDGIALLAGAMARLCGPRLPPIVRSLIPVLGSALECQRVTSSAFLAELLGHKVVNDLVLLEPILEALTALEKDSCLLVRVLALRGLGNVASGSPEKIRRHGAQLLASMLHGMDDKDDPNNLLALEAMSSLSKILDHLEERDVQSMLLHISIRIRPFFDSEHAALRHSSIVLFGNLSRFGRSDSEVFSEQILNGLVTLLLHLQDPQPDVVKACKFALRMCGPSLGCEELREMFGNHLREERGLHYGEFLNDVCKFLMRSRPALLGRLISTNLFYFKSSWRELRAAAAMSVGFLVLHVDEEQGQQVDLDQLISALQLLLKDPTPDVRIKAAETLGRLVRIL